jgi:hypothetical protein
MAKHFVVAFRRYRARPPPNADGAGIAGLTGE